MNYFYISSIIIVNKLSDYSMITVYFLEGIQEQIQLLRRRANAQYVSFRNYRQYTIYIITSDYITDLSCNTPHWRSTAVSLETYSFCT